MPDDYYELLGVGRNATDEEIKKAYRRLARELHPDTSTDPDAEENFKQLTVAYEVLRDPQRRQRYDMYGPEGVGTGGADPFTTMFGEGNLGDIFDAFLGNAFGGRSQRRTGPPPGSDAEVKIKLDFKEAVFGAQKDVSVKLPVPCDACEATGAKPGTNVSTCTTCNGAGEVRTVRNSILGQMVTASVCPRCAGMGLEVETPCDECRGEGRVTRERNHTVNVPAGVDNGFTLRLTDLGAAGPRGGVPGDLYVHLAVQPHDRFIRQGNDLICRLPIPITQAALGAELDFDTLDGNETLAISNGTQSGEVIKLRGKGVPRVNGHGRGDLLIELAVETPESLSKEEDELLRQLAELRGEKVAPPDPGLLNKLKSAFK